MKTYITYGFNHFDPDKFEISKNDIIENVGNKPKYAWWGSPVDAQYGWKDWCESERFGILANSAHNIDYVKWTLKKDTKILYIKDYSDLLNIPIKKEYFGPYLNIKIDFNNLRNSGYSGMELCMDKYYFGHLWNTPESAVKEVVEVLGVKNKTDLEKMLKLLTYVEEGLNTWDCDSICIWDKDVIDIIEEKSFNRENFIGDR